MTNFPKRIPTAIFSILTACLSASFAQTASAATFNFDLNTAPNGDSLNPYLIDGDGQTINSVLYSTTTGTNGNVGDIWSSIGIEVTAFLQNGTTSAPVGLFQSNCLPAGGTSNDGFTVPCDRNGDGDPDLATGDGSYGSITYNSPPQGVLLIVEENAGTNKNASGEGVPDDKGNGGRVRIDFNRGVLSKVKIGSITIVDDIKGSITIGYLNNSTYNATFNFTSATIGDNAVIIFDPDSGEAELYSEKYEPFAGATPNQKFNEYAMTANLNPNFANFNANEEVDFLEVVFDTRSGGLGGVFFSEFELAAAEVPEPSTVVFSLVSLGLMIFGGGRPPSDDEKK